MFSYFYCSPVSGWLYYVSMRIVFCNLYSEYYKLCPERKHPKEWYDVSNYSEVFILQIVCIKKAHGTNTLYVAIQALSVDRVMP